MRFLIILDPNHAITLERLAHQHHRSVRQEAEWLLTLVLRQAAIEQQGLEVPEVVEVADAPAR